MTQQGLCECGCGEFTSISDRNDATAGYVKGAPYRFRRGHSHARIDRYVRADGYVTVMIPGHPRASNGRVLEHVLVVETLLGRPLPTGAVIHHVGDLTDNGPGRLVVLQNQTEHLALHCRLRVLKAGGNPWTQRMCVYCRCALDVSQFYVLKRGRLSSHCRQCRKDRGRVKPEHRQRRWTRRTIAAMVGKDTPILAGPVPGMTKAE